MICNLIKSINGALPSSLKKELAEVEFISDEAKRLSAEQEQSLAERTALLEDQVRVSNQLRAEMRQNHFSEMFGNNIPVRDREGNAKWES